MNYRYDRKENFPLGRIVCDSCKKRLFKGDFLEHSLGCLDKQDEQKRTFIFGPSILKVVLDKAELLDSQNALVPYGDSLCKRFKLIAQNFFLMANYGLKFFRIWRAHRSGLFSILKNCKIFSHGFMFLQPSLYVLGT